MIPLGRLRDQTRRSMPGPRAPVTERRGSTRTQTHSCKSAVILSAVLPTPTADWASESGDAQLHKKLYAARFSWPLFLFLKSAQLICVSAGRSLTPSLLCVLRKQAFSESSIFSSLLTGFREGEICAQLGLQLKSLSDLTHPPCGTKRQTGNGRFFSFQQLHLPTSMRTQKSLRVSWVHRGKENPGAKRHGWRGWGWGWGCFEVPQGLGTSHFPREVCFYSSKE